MRSLRRALARPAPALVTVLVTALALAAIGCSQTPAERVADLRGKYEVTQFNFLPQDEPEAVPQVVDPVESPDEEGMIEPEPADMVTADVTATADDPADPDAVAGEPADEGAAATAAAAPTGTDVLFDVLLYFRGRDTLPGLTLDVTHADAAESEKGTYRHYVDTSGMIKGDSEQIAFTLEDLPFEEGDKFSVAVRGNVPEAERGEYREFAEAGS